MTILADTARSFAFLYLLAVLAPVVMGEADPAPVWTWPGVLCEPAAWCLAGLVTAEAIDGLRRAGRSARGLARASRRAWATLHPRRGPIGRWLHLTFFEPLTAPDQAREALARLCGYRLRGHGYRIASLRPSLRRGRFGVWVLVVHPSRHSRHWRAGYVRWVADPNELWLLRSALRPAAEPAPEPARAPAPGLLDRLDADGIDRLVRRRPEPAGTSDSSPKDFDLPTKETPEGEPGRPEAAGRVDR